MPTRTSRTQPIIVMFLLLFGITLHAGLDDDLLQAVKEPDCTLDEVKDLINRGALPDLQDEDGNPPLYYALDNSLHKIASYLIKNIGVSITWTNKCGITALHMAALRGYRDLAKFMIKEADDEISLNTQDDIGVTPLCIAAECGNLSIVTLLLDEQYKVCVDLHDYEGRTPLYFAALYNHEASVMALLQHGARFDAIPPLYRLHCLKYRHLQDTVDKQTIIPGTTRSGTIYKK